MGGGDNSDRPGLLAWLGATILTVGGVLTALLFAWVALGVFLVGERDEDFRESSDPRIGLAVDDVLTPDVPRETVRVVSTPRQTPDVVEVVLDLADATEVFLVYPPLPGGRPASAADTSSLLAFNNAGSLGVERGVPFAVPVDECSASCSLTMRLVDARGVHFFTDGLLEVAEELVARVPTQTVLELPLDAPITRDESLRFDVCVNGVKLVEEHDGLGRFVTIQQRGGQDQIAPNQIGMGQAPAESLHRSASESCQAMFRVEGSWGDWHNDDAVYDEIVLNVIHWGVTELDDQSAVIASVEIVE